MLLHLHFSYQQPLLFSKWNYILVKHFQRFTSSVGTSLRLDDVRMYWQWEKHWPHPLIPKGLGSNCVCCCRPSACWAILKKLEVVWPLGLHVHICTDAISYSAELGINTFSWYWTKCVSSSGDQNLWDQNTESWRWIFSQICSFGFKPRETFLYREKSWKLWFLLIIFVGNLLYVSQSNSSPC